MSRELSGCALGGTGRTRTSLTLPYDLQPNSARSRRRLCEYSNHRGSQPGTETLQLNVSAAWLLWVLDMAVVLSWI